MLKSEAVNGAEKDRLDKLEGVRAFLVPNLGSVCPLFVRKTSLSAI